MSLVGWFSVKNVYSENCLSILYSDLIMQETLPSSCIILVTELSKCEQGVLHNFRYKVSESCSFADI